MGPSRRTVLASLGAAGTGATAGCLSRLSGDTRLGRVTVSNHDDHPHTFDLRVREGGTVVHRSTVAVEGREQGRIHGETAPCEWGGEPGTYEVAVRVDEGAWTAHSLADAVGTFESVDCLTASAWYLPDGELLLRMREDCRRYEGRWLVGSPCARAEQQTQTQG